MIEEDGSREVRTWLRATTSPCSVTEVIAIPGPRVLSPLEIAVGEGLLKSPDEFATLTELRRRTRWSALLSPARHLRHREDGRVSFEYLLGSMFIGSFPGMAIIPRLFGSPTTVPSAMAIVLVSVIAGWAAFMAPLVAYRNWRAISKGVLRSRFQGVNAEMLGRLLKSQEVLACPETRDFVAMLRLEQVERERPVPRAPSALEVLASPSPAVALPAPAVVQESSLAEEGEVL